MTTIRNSLCFVFSATLGLIVLFLLGGLEYLAIYYVPFWVYALIISVSYLALFLLGAGLNGIEKFVFPTLFTLGLLLVFSDMETSSQTMLRRLRRIEPGMDIAQVETIMVAYQRNNRLFGIQNAKRLPSGQFVLVEPDYAMYKPSTPDDGTLDAASGFVYFKAGKATSVEYRGD